MAKDRRPDFSCKTNDRPNSLVDAPCKKACKVTYKFTFRSKVSLPYAVAINGKVLPAFKDRPKRTDGRISLVVDAGQAVQLFLNSDAHPAFRQHPVYLVKTGDDDVEVVIIEVAGKHSESDTPTLAHIAEDGDSGRTVQHMTAKLTGDIWMKVSHKYTADEVDTRLPAGTSEEVRAAVKEIYYGLSAASLEIKRPAQGGQPARTLTVRFADSSNPKENICNYTLLSDGLPRVHPGGYAALINAAFDSEVQSVSVSSCWRPMLGSIAHRAGLGLDVSVVGGTTINRQELRRALSTSKASPHGNGNDKDNVTDAEVTAFGVYEQALIEDKKAKAELDASRKALLAAKKSSNGDAIAAAQERLDESTKAARKAAKVASDKRMEWNAERDAGEPEHVRQYRVSLLKCTCVRQLFDPWFMDANVKGAVGPEPNMQRSDNETLHAHHLHITVEDPSIL